MDTQTNAGVVEPAAPRLVSIVPPVHNGGGACPVQGTRVLDVDGKEIDGVTKVVISVEAGDVWKAEISCVIRPVRLDGVALDGPVLDVTCIEDGVRRYERVEQ